MLRADLGALHMPSIPSRGTGRTRRFRHRSRAATRGVRRGSNELMRSSLVITGVDRDPTPELPRGPQPATPRPSPPSSFPRAADAASDRGAAHRNPPGRMSTARVSTSGSGRCIRTSRRMRFPPETSCRMLTSSRSCERTGCGRSGRATATFGASGTSRSGIPSSNSRPAGRTRPDRGDSGLARAVVDRHAADRGIAEDDPEAGHDIAVVGFIDGQVPDAEIGVVALPADRYADWAAVPRERLPRRHLPLLDLVAEDAIARGDLDEATSLLDTRSARIRWRRCATSAWP